MPDASTHPPRSDGDAATARRREARPRPGRLDPEEERSKGRDGEGADEGRSEGPPPGAEDGDEGADKGGDGENGPKQGRRGPPRWLLIGAAALLFAGGAWWGWRWWSHARLHESTENAYVQAHVARISPRVAGHVLRVAIVDNQAVAEGDLLFELDPRDMQAQREAAAAALAAARGRLAQAGAAVQVARAGAGEAAAEVEVAAAEAERASDDAARYRNLSRAAAPAQERDRADASERAAKARLEAARRRQASAEAQATSAVASARTAEAEAAQAEARLREAELNLAHTRVLAPFAGRVTQRRVEPGDYARPGGPVLSLVGEGRWVEANFKETQLADMRPGQPATLEADAFPDAPFRGRVESVQRGTGAAFAVLPPQNATGNWVKVVQRVPVRIEFDDESARRIAAGELQVSPGMSVEAEVRVR